MIKIQDRAPELRAEAEKVGLTVREDASVIFRSPFIYLYAYGDRDRFIILSDAAEMGEDGFYVGRYRVNESGPVPSGERKADRNPLEALAEMGLRETARKDPGPHVQHLREKLGLPLEEGT